VFMGLDFGLKHCVCNLVKERSSFELPEND
jgi:hypothetical protein